MKRIVFCLFVILILSNSAYASNLIINGFYIGMKKDKAINNISKLGLIINDNLSTNNKLFIEETYNKINNYYGLIIFDNDVISMISFNAEIVFNFKNMDFERFIHEFCIHYKLSINKLIKLSDNMYSYTDNDNGYQVAFTATTIILGMLQKPSELKFK